MEKQELIDFIENIAPLETQEKWDCSGWIIETSNKKIKKVLLTLSVTKDIVAQALEKKCDIIISHHPLFFVPFEFNQGVDIYSAHTNLDKAQGGTTDTVLEELGFSESQKTGEFLRIVTLEKPMELFDLLELVKEKLSVEGLRFVNNFNKSKVQKIALCAGSGGDFLEGAKQNGADVLITGDIKYHLALGSDIILIDAGHFETERPVLKKLSKLFGGMNLEVVIADEKNPISSF